ncbi:MAG TPA: SDR family NAD(P)-dependent oxidoreductase [Steroidobacteraceae bacterium]|nr:SDR family NAD(P)-dependent oxidoreductase [Steroidobacteraceae bacterium]
MRSVIVTGGSRGLGLAIALALTAQGYRVIAIARSQSAELLAGIESAAQAGSGSLTFRSCDLSRTSELAKFVGTLRKEFGPIYGLVNNAGLGTAGVLSLMPDDEIEALVRLNTIAPLLVTKYVLRSMMVEKAGRIINMASIVATNGYSGLSAYSATKAALLGFTRSLAREVGPLNITVNAIAPGFIDTDMTQSLDEKQRDQIARRSALKRMAGAGDVASAVLYLLSDSARNITGMTLTVDAGNTA